MFERRDNRRRGTRWRGYGVGFEWVQVRISHGLVEVVVNSCRLLTQNEFFLLLVYSESYFL